ncbi:hypothetical protein [Maribacter antarcticus]|uniref:hypothetical protein n=1 Tax=Maribacter antarcticus TaxID=505250 RepID=UPI000478FD52|nr:hypothetical protein [Maribacter antarcticus]
MAKKIRWHSERILSLSAMTISFFTLIMFTYQTNLMSQQNYLAILPYVSISTANNPVDNTFSLSIDNFGVGPAIIESIMAKHKGESFDLSDFNDEVLKFLKTRGPELDSLKVISNSTLDKGLAIPVNASYNIMEVKNSQKDYQLLTNSLNKLLEDGFYFEIIYKSIQNERWMITNNTQGPKN